MRGAQFLKATAVVALTSFALLASGVARAGVADHEVTVDFSSYGAGRVFDPTFYRHEGLVFPAERCGPAGCDSWFVGFVQGDAALVQTPLLGPVEATFTRPVSNLSLRVAPSLQGTATYTLKAFSASGHLIESSSLTVTEDFGDPANTGFGYFTISLVHLAEPAKRFTLDNVFVRSSFPGITEIPYGVSSISYRQWSGAHSM